MSRASSGGECPDTDGARAPCARAGMWGCVPQQEGSVPTQCPPNSSARPMWGFPFPGVLHGLEPTFLGKTLISAAAELTLNFVVDKGHGKGSCRSLVCRENRSFGYSCVLFQSGSSKKVTIQCVCVCVCAELLQNIHGFAFSHTINDHGGLPTHLFLLLHLHPPSHRMLPLHQSPTGSSEWHSASCSRARSLP